MPSLKETETLNTLGTAGDLAKSITDEDSITRYTQGRLTSWVFTHGRALMKIWLVLALLELSIVVLGKTNVLLTGAGLSALFTAVGIGGLLHGRGEFVRGLLRPLADSGDCGGALLLVAQSTQAAQWRDLAVAEGRALRMFDLKVMECLAIKGSEVAYRESQELLCRQLHGVSV